MVGARANLWVDALGVVRARLGEVPRLLAYEARGEGERVRPLQLGLAVAGGVRQRAALEADLAGGGGCGGGGVLGRSLLLGPGRIRGARGQDVARLPAVEADVLLLPRQGLLGPAPLPLQRLFHLLLKSKTDSNKYLLWIEI